MRKLTLDLHAIDVRTFMLGPVSGGVAVAAVTVAEQDADNRETATLVPELPARG